MTEKLLSDFSFETKSEFSLEKKNNLQKFHRIIARPIVFSLDNLRAKDFTFRKTVQNNPIQQLGR